MPHCLFAFKRRAFSPASHLLNTRSSPPACSRRNRDTDFGEPLLEGVVVGWRKLRLQQPPHRPGHAPHQPCTPGPCCVRQSFAEAWGTTRELRARGEEEESKRRARGEQAASKTLGGAVAVGRVEAGDEPARHALALAERHDLWRRKAGRRPASEVGEHALPQSLVLRRRHLRRGGQTCEKEDGGGGDKTGEGSEYGKKKRRRERGGRATLEPDQRKMLVWWSRRRTLSGSSDTSSSSTGVYCTPTSKASQPRPRTRGETTAQTTRAVLSMSSLEVVPHLYGCKTA
eukprot:3398656-Rhodomonas_salina.2